MRLRRDRERYHDPPAYWFPARRKAGVESGRPRIGEVVLRYLRVFIPIALVLTLAAPNVALAWGTGAPKSPGYGAHQWLLSNGNRFAGLQGIGWLDEAVATAAAKSVDGIRGDQPNHNYDRWGKHYGHADWRIRTLYARAVAAYKAGDRAEASRLTGLIAHYYADVCDPLHTDDSKYEPKIFTKFERSVDWLLRRRGLCTSWVAYDGYQRVGESGAWAAASAKTAHLSYRSLVDHYRRHGFDSTAVKIAKQSANRATNGIADLIMSVQQDAVEASASPDIHAHQGIAVSPDFYYVFHTSNITRYDRSWNQTGTNIDPLADLEGFTQPHLGDGCYYDGKLYVVAENYPDVTNQMILVYDAITLERIDAIPTGRTHEVASIVAVPDQGEHGVLYVASFTDSSRLYKYDLKDYTYLGTLMLTPAPTTGIQGIAYNNGTLYLAVGRTYGIGYLYSVAENGATKLLYKRVSAGTHEGIAFDGKQLLWLVNRGMTDSRVLYLDLPLF